MPAVWNKRDPNVPADAVYVGRPTKFGNPFKMNSEVSRAQVIVQYRKYLRAHPQLIVAARRELRGKDLVCWCAPLPCHAEALLEVANAD